MFDKLKRSIAAARLVEEQLYEQVALEMSNGERREGLWAKALADSAGDDQKTTGLYIKYRVRAMIDEAEVMEGLAEAAQTNVAHERIAEKARSDPSSGFKACEARLVSKGFKLNPEGSGWIVIEPWGGQAHIKTLAALEQYADLRG